MTRAGERAGLADLERQALAQNARFKHWECTDALMRRTRGGRALYMHCLPADVTDVSCPAGEVRQAVSESGRLETYREASYKPFIIASMILNTRFPGATATLTHILDDGRPRRGHAG